MSWRNLMTYKVDFRSFESQRRFGVELETGGEVSKIKVKNILKKLSTHGAYSTKYQLTSSGSCWHIKDDATCGKLGRQGPKGVEIASYVGKGLDDINHISEVAQGLSDAGCQVNRNCGLHIHAEAKDITLSQLGVILAYWIKIENVIKMALPMRRWDNVYCTEILDKCKFAGIISDNKNVKYSSDFLLFALQPTDLSFYENDDRRVNLNLVNYYRAIRYGSDNRKTLELRWPEGSLSKQDVKNWVVIFLNFIDKCKDLKMPKNLMPASLHETLHYLGLNHTDEKCFSIFDETLYDAKMWLLERIIHNQSFKHSKIDNKVEILMQSLKLCNKISNKSYQFAEIVSQFS